jgi:hypothetical protein
LAFVHAKSPQRARTSASSGMMGASAISQQLWEDRSQTATSRTLLYSGQTHKPIRCLAKFLRPEVSTTRNQTSFPKGKASPLS